MLSRKTFTIWNMTRLQQNVWNEARGEAEAGRDGGVGGAAWTETFTDCAFMFPVGFTAKSFP